MSATLIQHRTQEEGPMVPEVRLTYGPNLVRCESPAQVVSIAQANRVSYSHSDYAASVTLANSVCYFWSAA